MDVMIYLDLLDIEDLCILVVFFWWKGTNFTHQVCRLQQTTPKRDNFVKESETTLWGANVPTSGGSAEWSFEMNGVLGQHLSCDQDPGCLGHKDDTVDGSEIRRTSSYLKYPLFTIIYRVLYIPVVQDFWTINRIITTQLYGDY